MEGVEQTELCTIFLAEVVIEVGEFDVDLAPLELILISVFDFFFRLEQRVEGLHVGIPLRVVHK